MNQAGFLIKYIYCDHEFKPLMEKIGNELDVKMNYTSRDEHVPKTERNNCTITEQIQARYYQLPYKGIPKLMPKYSTMVSTYHLNLFLAKEKVLSYLSPHIILGGHDLDYNKYCTIPFGAYVQVH